MYSHLPLRNIEINDAFFAPRMLQARTVSIPYMWEALHDRIEGVAPSGCIANFRIAAHEQEGAFTGWWFQDSDLWKWIEGAAYSLSTHPDEKLQNEVDEVIALAGRAQQEDGYLDTYYIINGLENRFTNLRDHHEMYIAGHMFEAAVAYFEATGKKNLLHIACRFADCLDRNFGPEEEKLHGYPGHEEVELGLARLYGATGEKRYLRLAAYFLDQRGTKPLYFEEEARRRGEKPRNMDAKHAYAARNYHQSDIPVREMTAPFGHAVRQCYLLSGMVETGGKTGDETLVDSARRVFRRIISRQMYITGGIGSCHEGESFTFDYDLPPERCYTETCAAISLIMTAIRLNRVKPHAVYGDIVEKALYNGILSGISLDGQKYFYMNPLEVWPERCETRTDVNIDDVRQGWFGCACCPPNILRTLTGLGQYLYTAGERKLYVDQFVSSSLVHDGLGLRLCSGFPWNGNVSMEITQAPADEYTLAVRIPSWAKDTVFSLNGCAVQPEKVDGYAVWERVFSVGDRIDMVFPMQPVCMYASRFVPDYAGQLAVQCGPVIYCAEEVDNGRELWNLCVNPHSLSVTYDPSLLQGVNVIHAEGVRMQGSEALYSENAPAAEPVPVTMVPYYAWGNRGKGEMRVWMHRV